MAIIGALGGGFCFNDRSQPFALENGDQPVFKRKLVVSRWE
jgi:hypothetical protein